MDMNGWCCIEHLSAQVEKKNTIYLLFIYLLFTYPILTQNSSNKSLSKLHLTQGLLVPINKLLA